MTPKIILISFFLLLTSCVKEVDFDQSDDLSIQPKLVITLVNFNYKTNIPPTNTSFSLPTFEEKVPIIIDKLAIRSDKVKNALIKIQGRNSVDTQVEIVIEFYKNGFVTYRFQQRLIEANKSFKFVETISNADLDRFASSDEVYIKILFHPFVPINLNPAFNVQLIGEFDLIIQN